MVRLCENCGKEIELDRSNHRFCCKKCNNQKYYQDNIEKAREQSKKYRQENPKRIKEWNKKWRQEHPQKIKEHRKKYIQKRREKSNEERKKYYKENKTFCENCGKEFEPNRRYQRFCCKKCNSQKWRWENPKKVKEYCKRNYRKNREKNKEKNKRNYQKDKENFRGYYQENKEYYKEYHKRRYQENREKVKEMGKIYYQKNKDYVSKRSKKYRKKNKEKIKKSSKRYRQKNKEKIKEHSRRPEIKKGRNAYLRKWRLIPKNKINNSISGAIRESLIGRKNGKHWEDLVGYTLKDLMAHLEKQFDDKMNWDNYGPYWHIDHIKPRSLFNFSSYEDKEFQECWALSNLQPLECIENLRKKNKYQII